MIYPNFLRPNDTIGITAPSCGVPEAKRENFELSLSQIKKQGYNITLTDNVYKCGQIASSPADVRAKELHSLLEDPDIDMIWAACGGDMLVEMLEHIDYEKIKANPKWIMGYSDITGLVFPITLMCDIATVYGPNAGSFDMTELHPSLENALSFIKGNIKTQYSSKMYERNRIKDYDGYNLDTPTEWFSAKGDFTVSGRMLSTCIDCSMFLVGTKYAPVEEFIEKYKDDGIIWNFDNYALSTESLYYALWNMKNAGWFKHAKAVMISRVLYPSANFDFTYSEAAQNALGDIPVVLETDTGHVKPQFTLINGSMCTLKISGKVGSLETKLC